MQQQHQLELLSRKQLNTQNCRFFQNCKPFQIKKGQYLSVGNLYADAQEGRPHTNSRVQNSQVLWGAARVRLLVWKSHWCEICSCGQICKAVAWPSTTAGREWWLSQKQGHNKTPVVTSQLQRQPKQVAQILHRWNEPYTWNLTPLDPFLSTVKDSRDKYSDCFPPGPRMAAWPCSTQVWD